MAQIEHALASLRRPQRPMGVPADQHGGRGFRGAAMLRLLHVLADAGDRNEQLGVGEVAESIGVDQPRSSRLVSAGVERGYVIRETDVRDARRSVIRITAEGRSHLEHVRARQHAAVETSLAGFTPQDAATLAELLVRFAAAWRRH